MAIGRKPKEKWDYVLKHERNLPKEKQTVFHLRTLTLEEDAKIMDHALVMDQNNEARAKSGTTIIETLKCGLTGWDNFLDESGNAIPFKMTSDKCHVSNLEWLLPAWRKEICEAITERNSITEEEEKNSESEDSSSRASSPVSIA